MPDNMPDNSPQSIHSRYQRAKHLMQSAVGYKKLVLNATIAPCWIENSDCFWYPRETPQGHEYRLVNESHNALAFDHNTMAKLLAEQSGQGVDSSALPLTDIKITLSPCTVTFSAFEKRWCYNDEQAQLEPISADPSYWTVSPDQSQAAFIREHNIWVRDIATGKERALTTDGEKFYRYGSEPTVFGYVAPQINDFVWSPDSRKLLAHRIDTRHLPTAYALVEHVPVDASVRPQLYNAERKLALGGEDDYEAWEFLSIDTVTAAVTPIDQPPCPMIYPVYLGYYLTGRGWWGANSQHAYNIYQAIDGTHTRVVRWDTDTGVGETCFSEDPEISLLLTPTSHSRTLATPLPASNELIWYSERSGWGHLYLYDQVSGALKQTITSGDWLVSAILHVDPEQRTLLIQTTGRTPGKNPYHADICRVHIDTGELTTLYSCEQNISVQDHRYSASPNLTGVSPSGRYIVATQSSIDTTSHSVLLNADGQNLLTLETANTDAIPEPWQRPEVLLLKGADGLTDIHTIIFRPSDFDPNKQYPVVDLSWGHSPPINAFELGGQGYFGAMAWAELGFIVVKFGNRGGGLRGKAFHEDVDSALPHYNKADCAAGLQQLAQRFAYIDINRVGVASYLLYPEALTSLLIYPDLYKVGVDTNPMSNPKLMANIGNFGGGLKHPPHEDFVDNLKGKLLLIHGMMEDVVPVSNTLRLVEALQNAGKNVDMLLLPNVDHSGPLDYITKRSWDYLVTHLLGEEPPEEYDHNLSVDVSEVISHDQ